MKVSKKTEVNQEVTTINNITANFNNEFPNRFLDKDTWPSDKCWYCEERAPNEKASRTTILAKKHPDKQGKYKLVQIITPRCQRCKRVHSKRSILNFVVAILASFPLLILYIFLMGKIFDNIGVLGFIVMLILWATSGMLIIYFLPKIIMSKTKTIKDKKSEMEITSILRIAGWSEYLD